MSGSGLSLLSADGIVEAFGDQWRRSDLSRVMPEPVVIANRDPRDWQGQWVELTLIAVYDEHQDKGYASRALEMLTALCDANSMTIKLVANPMHSTQSAGCSIRLTKRELVAWYKRYGFVDGTPEMIREPRLSSVAPG